MSIILDALKKMDDEGGTKSSPGRQPPSERLPSGRRKGLLLSLGAAALSLSLLAVLLWRGEREGAGERGAGGSAGPPVGKQVAIAPGGAAPVAALPGLELPVASSVVAAPVGERPAASPESADGGGRPGAGASEQGVEGAASVKPAPPAVAPPVARLPLPPAVQEIADENQEVTVEGVPADEEGETYDGSLLLIEELPGDLRPGVDDLRISAHVYSDDPAFRRVAVNDTLRREGDKVTVDLLVEEITERGAIFSYRGYRIMVEPR